MAAQIWIQTEAATHQAVCEGMGCQGNGHMSFFRQDVGDNEWFEDGHAWEDLNKSVM